MVAAVASDEPQIAPKPAQAPTEAMATPPLRWPSQPNTTVIPAQPRIASTTWIGDGWNRRLWKPQGST